MSPNSPERSPLSEPVGLAPYAAAPGAGYRGDGGGGDEDEEGGLDIERLVSAIIRQKYLVAGITLLGCVLGIGLARIVKPVYEAQASIQVPVIVRGGGAPAPMRAGPILEGRGWVELIRSFAVLDEVVRQRRLFIEFEDAVDPSSLRDISVTQNVRPGSYRVAGGADRVRLLDANGAVLEEVTVGDSIGRSIGVLWVPGPMAEGRELGFRLREPRDAAVQLGDNLVTTLPPEGALLRISLRSVDPAAASATLNAVAERFVAVATLLKREKLTTVTEVLQEQLVNARGDLAGAESALESFKVSTITLPTDRGAPAIVSGLAQTQDPVRQAFFALRTERESIARDRDAIQRALRNDGDSARAAVVALSTIPAVREARELMQSIDLLTDKRAELRQALLLFASTRPEVTSVQRAIEDLERRTIPSQARALAENLTQQLEELDSRVAVSSRDMQQIPVRITEENRRQRNVAVAELIYTELQSAYEQARLAELNATPDVRILDSAVPPTRPVRDQLFIILAGGLAGGLGLGLALALLLDRFDPRIRYPEQVTGQLGLRILGAVPLLKVGKDGRPDPEEAALLVESIRAIRMGLLYAHGTAGTFVTTITSPGPGDGKSFVSAQLAKSFAISGRRTLIIDGDNRRGLLHRSLGIDRKPGLIDILTGGVSLEEAVRRDEKSGFDIIPCGTRRASAPELLASPAMVQLLVRLRGMYDAIIIDSPPMGAGVDPLILASLSGTLVVVLRSGQTDRAMAEARMGDLQRLPVRVLGAVLNDVKSGGVYRYYSYLPGYRTGDEEDEQEIASPLLPR